MLVDFSLEKLNLSGLTATGIRGRLAGKNDVLALNPCSFDFYDAKVDLSGTTDMVSASHEIGLELHGLNLGALLRDAAGIGTIGGRVDLQADITAGGTGADAVKKSLGGTASLTGSAEVDTGMLPEELRKLAGDVDSVSLTSVTLGARAARGNVRLSPLKASGRNVGVGGSGSLDVPAGTLDLDMKASVAGVTVPFGVSGPVNRPVCRVDTRRLIRGLVVDTPGETVKTIEQGVKDIRNIFRGLHRK